MPFCVLGSDLSDNGYLQVDNLFMSRYLPFADPLDCKVYLYGLFIATREESFNTIEKISLAFKISEERIISAFNYWESKGLVTISKSHPLRITYHSVKMPITPVIRYNAREYSTFVDEFARLFSHKILIQDEYEAFIRLMKEFKIETNAMLMIISYALSIKCEAGVAYILAIASDFAKKGMTTEKRVTEHIANLEQNNEDIRSIFNALGIKSQADLEDRQLYLKWTREYGMTLDAILTAARTLKKKGGMLKLGKVIDEFYNAGALTAKEIFDLTEAKDKNISLAKEIVTIIGVYYSSFDMIVETYVLPWQAMGYERDALLTIAKLCFLRSIKTLDAMNTIVERLHKKGIVHKEALDSYIKNQEAIDALIKEVLAVAGALTFISNRDRELYSTFREDWGFSHEIILLAAEQSQNKPFPMSNISRLLASLKEKGITKYEEAQGFLKNPQKTQNEKAQKDYIQQDYSKERYESVFKEYSGSLFAEDD